MKWRIVALGLVCGILLPFAANCAGRHIYAYFTIGEKDLIFGSALGLAHIAWAEHDEPDTVFGMELADEYSKTLVDIAFIHIFTEPRGDSMTPLTFRMIRPDEYYDYRGVEFPMLLPLVVPLAIVLVAKPRPRAEQAAGDPPPAHRPPRE